MKWKFFIGFMVFSLMLFACEQKQKKEETYNKYTSVDNTYCFVVPSYATQQQSTANFMSFEGKSSNLVIVVRRISENSINEYMRNNDVKQKSFNYSLFQSSDSTYFYKITRGNNMWSAYDLYMFKRLDGRNYLVNASSDIISQSRMVDMIRKIYLSLERPQIENKDKVIDEKNVATRNDVQSISLEKTYSTKYYSIKYPKEWKVVEQINEMTDVYIGSQPDNFGFTIVRFETDVSLSEANNEGNSNVKQAGFKILEDKQITLNGVKCYKATHEITLQGKKIQTISYTFKKGDMFYNIRFGSVVSKSQEPLVTEIMKSFRFK